jgi:DTW domain-containing protein YfiP
MSKRRSSSHKRCPECRINENSCFCHEIKKIETQTSVSIIMHHREKHLTSNTANLARLVLTDCKIIMRGLQGKTFDISECEIGEATPLYLFPHEGAIDLTPEYLATLKKPIHLIVPDGTWSQAVKTYRREPSLAQVQCVKLPPGDPGAYKLRKSSTRENSVSTYEAIARALSILEYPEIEAEMQRIFDIFVDRTIRGRKGFDLKE